MNSVAVFQSTEWKKRWNINNFFGQGYFRTPYCTYSLLEDNNCDYIFAMIQGQLSRLVQWSSLTFILSGSVSTPVGLEQNEASACMQFKLYDVTV